MIWARSAGSTRNAASRAATSVFHVCRSSGMLGLRDASDGGDEALPPRSLLSQDLLAGRSQAVIAPSPLTFFLDPAAGDPAALLEPVEQRIERGNAKAHGAF